MKYLCEKGMSPKETYDDFIKALGDEPSSFSMVKKWAAELRRGRESVKDYERSGRHKEAATDENVELVYSLIMCDRRRSLHDNATQIGVSFGAVQSILTETWDFGPTLWSWGQKTEYAMKAQWLTTPNKCKGLSLGRMVM